LEVMLAPLSVSSVHGENSTAQAGCGNPSARNRDHGRGCEHGRTVSELAPSASIVGVFLAVPTFQRLKALSRVAVLLPMIAAGRTGRSPMCD
jgi:hypothetical protein